MRPAKEKTGRVEAPGPSGVELSQSESDPSDDLPCSSEDTHAQYHCRCIREKDLIIFGSEDIQSSKSPQNLLTPSQGEASPLTEHTGQGLGGGLSG